MKKRDYKLKWQNLEDNVRSIATYLWDEQAISEKICGVQIDCVVKKSSDYWYLVEITKQNSLEKIREDISKLSSINLTLLSQGIYVKKYIVMNNKPTDSMRTTGKASNVDVFSIEEFEKKWFDYKDYIFRRSTRTFGSVINIETGAPEECGKYIPVHYTNIHTNETLSITDISKRLKQGRKIILKGGFGTGKSRCIKQLFDILSKEHEREPIYTIAINLREHWGTKSYKELLLRHFEDLSINAENFKKIQQNKNIIFLLDGFDEIGSQSWSETPEKMRKIRERAVLSIKDLIKNTQGGCLITGREHYFDSDDEMKECFGLPKDTLILECAEEFNIEQIKDYVRSLTGRDITYFPPWLPKRPLVMSIAVHGMEELFNSENDIINECDFWFCFLDLLSKREARINTALDEIIIKKIMIRVARKSRIKAKDNGPITLQDLNNAFEEVTGERPNEESAIMLYRLPGLGRIDNISNDRIFVDSYILNGLKAEDIIQAVKNNETTILNENWYHSLNKEGNSILLSYLNNKTRIDSFMRFIISGTIKKNSTLLADIVAAISNIIGEKEFDFKNIFINNSQISLLDFSNKSIKNLNLSSILINEMDITNSKFDNVKFDDCVINQLNGISSKTSLPSIFQKCKIEEYQAISTVNRIKNANLTRSQIVLVTIIKKLFSTITKGNGRKEEALLRGLGDKGDSKMCNKIINKMISDGIINKHKGDDGWIYSPILKNTDRMNQILSNLTNSKDELWQYATSLEKN